MALTSTQQALKLFKQLMGTSDSKGDREFFEEPILSNQVVLASQIWTESDKIPATAPKATSALAVGDDAVITGVVQSFYRKTLTAVPGSSFSFSHADLKNTIPFNFDSGGSYNYQLYDSTGAAIPFGIKNWIVDTAAGTLTFYGDGGVQSTPSNMPPKITFYKYVGMIGAGDGVVQYVETYTLTATDISNKYITLTAIPLEADDVVLSVRNAGAQQVNSDFAMDLTNTDRLSWNGKGLQGFLEEGDELTVVYNAY